jgi:tRNA threonylcarbamoyladenosine biosynthesis protein TsaE
MQDLGAQLAAALRAGDVVIANGDLGAGKTTLTQGIGRGLGTQGPVISPTFVLSRIHHSPAGPDLVHVDAYRLTSATELDDLDLDATLSQSVTVVEWGSGVADHLAESRLDVEIRRNPYSQADSADERMVVIRQIGPRWCDVDLAADLGGPR